MSEDAPEHTAWIVEGANYVARGSVLHTLGYFITRTLKLEGTDVEGNVVWILPVITRRIENSKISDNIAIVKDGQATPLHL